MTMRTVWSDEVPALLVCASYDRTTRSVPARLRYMLHIHRMGVWAQVCANFDRPGSVLTGARTGPGI
jgi:hypothetical protein